MPLQIHAFETGPVATIAYLVFDDTTKDAVIIDAPIDSAGPIATDAEQLGVTPSALVLTHTHWDHTGDAAELRRRFPEILLYVHPDDEYRLAEPAKHSVWDLPFTLEGVSADRHLRDGDTIEVGSLGFKVIHTPGHTEGGICLYDADAAVVFVGDTIFAGSVGRTDLPGGDWDTLADSIQERLMSLPDAVQVYPGHGMTTTIGKERSTNPFVGDGS